MAEACRPDKVLKPHHAGLSFVQRNNPSVRLWHGPVVRLGGTSTSCVASMGGECRNVRGPGPIWSGRLRARRPNGLAALRCVRIRLGRPEPAAAATVSERSLRFKDGHPERGVDGGMPMSPPASRRRSAMSPRGSANLSTDPRPVERGARGQGFAGSSGGIRARAGRRLGSRVAAPMTVRNLRRTPSAEPLPRCRSSAPRSNGAGVGRRPRRRARIDAGRWAGASRRSAAPYGAARRRVPGNRSATAPADGRTTGREPTPGPGRGGRLRRVAGVARGRVPTSSLR